MGPISLIQHFYQLFWNRQWVHESGLVEPEISSGKKVIFFSIKKTHFWCFSPFRSSPLCTLPDPLLADRDPWPTSWLYLGMNAKRIVGGRMGEGLQGRKLRFSLILHSPPSSNQCCAERTFGCQERDSCVLGQIQPKSILKLPEGV